MISLKISLNTSANGCKRPSGPTRFGPMRTCIQPMILRSAYVMYATPRISGTAMATILASVHTTGQTGPKNPATGASIASMSVPARPPEGY